jgi:6-phosphogluconolactonase (cycloisomerase 2 family)
VKARSLPLIGALSALFLIAAATPAAAASPAVGAVYALTNAAGGNAVLAFERHPDGSLGELGSFATGGLGSGGGLGSQGAVVLSDDGRLLVAVDAGSDEISSFTVGTDGTLTLVDRVPSGGDHPISVTVWNGLAYALNDGGAGNIAGFTIDGSGDLAPIAGSSRPLSAAGVAPAQVAFSPDGESLAVTEKDTNRITTYAVDADGLAGSPTFIASAGATPFGFAFDDRGRIFVSEAFGGAADASTLSSYAVADGAAALIDGPDATTESAACWVAVTKNGQFAYTANTGSGTISGFAIAQDGSVSLITPDGATGITGGAPADLAMSANGRFLYARVGGASPAVAAFRVGGQGDLSPLGTIALPAGVVGMAGR